MTIAVDQSGATAVITNTTSGVIDITTAADGKWVYLWALLTGSITVAPSATGWTAIATDSPNSTLLKRKKVTGDTTFTVNWTGSAQGVLAWVSINGAHPTLAEESAASTDFSGTTRTGTPTPSASPTAADRFALAFFTVKAAATGTKAITWTSDAALTEVLDVNNSAASDGSWVGTEIAISPAAVTNASHQYTATHNFTETRDFSAILYLIPDPNPFFGSGFFEGV